MASCLLKIVVFPETRRTWTARCLNHDLAAEGRTIEAAIDTLVKIARAHIAYDLRHNRAPLSAFATAPPVYWTAFARGTRLPVALSREPSLEPQPQIVASIVSLHPAVRVSEPVARTA